MLKLHRQTPYFKLATEYRIEDRSVIHLPLRVINFNKLAVKSGVMVQGVEADGLAYNSEIESGDIIVAFNDQPGANIDDLQRKTPLAASCRCRCCEGASGER